MNNLAQKTREFPRSELNRILSYRPHVKWVYYWQNTFAAIYFAGCLFLSLFIALKLASKDPFNATLFSVIILATGSLLTFVILAVNKRTTKPLAFSKIYVFSDKLILNRMGEEIEIPFYSVNKVDFKFISNMGGWFSLCLDNGKSYKFTVVLERSEYILESLANNNPKLFENQKEKYSDYRRLAIMADHSWARIYEGLTFKSLLKKYALFPIALAFIISLTSLLVFKKEFTFQNFSHFIIRDLIKVGILNLIVGYLTFTFESIYFTVLDRRQLKDNPDKVERDLNSEKKISKISTYLRYIVFAITLVFLYKFY
jgi:hypothetical protein